MESTLPRALEIKRLIKHANNAMNPQPVAQPPTDTNMLIDTTTGAMPPPESREEDGAAPMKLEEHTATVKEENDEDPDQSDDA